MNSKTKKILVSFLPSILSVVIALLIGSVIIMLKGVNPVDAYYSMFKLAFYQSNPKYPFNGLAQTLVYATPLLLASLAVMFASKSGLLNIGVQGQMIAGGLGATIVGVYAKGIFANMFFAVLVAVIFGFIWAGIAGYLKAQFNVHEVISTIMLNYIMINFQNYLLIGPLKDPNVSNNQSLRVVEAARFPTLFQAITKQSLNIGLILAIILVILIYYFFKNTKLGYDMKVVGYSPSVAKNAGINPQLIAILAMGLSGAIAGLAGAERILGGSTQYAYTEAIMADFGFTGFAVALLGKQNPFGIFIASIFYSALEIGGQTLQLKYGLEKEIVYIIQALIIIFIAAENGFKYFVKKRKDK